MRKNYSARHIPDKIYQVTAIPYTLTGKKMEVPVRRILMGVPVEKAVNRAAMSNVDSLDFSSTMRANNEITGCRLDER
jgi:acetoacetyl-CoA synthetase